MFQSRKRGAEESTEKTKRISLVADAFTVIASGVWTVWPILIAGGVPAYRHDWSWPLDSSRACDAMSTIGSTWLNEGLGHPNPFANANPASYAIVGLPCALHPVVALKIFLALIIAVAGFGVLRLCSKAGLSSSAARIAAAFYLLAPPFFSKVSAGQFAYWCSFALLPWVIERLLRLREQPTISNVAALALIAALSFVQPQFIVFDGLAIAVACLVTTNRAFIISAVTAFLLALCLNAPAIYAALAMTRDFAFTVPHPTDALETLQSAFPASAFEMMGYVIPYAESAFKRLELFGAPAGALFALCGVAVAGLLCSWRLYVGRLMFGLGLSGFIVMTGLRGPLHVLFRWGMEHISGAALLREFYHAAALVALAYAIGLSLFANRSIIRATIVWSLVTCAFLPFAFAGHNVDLNSYTIPHDYRAEIKTLATSSPGRFLPLPYKMPMAPRENANGYYGYDELAYADRAHSSIGEYGATQELDAVAALAQSGNVETARDLLARYSVTAMILRPYLISAASLQLIFPNEKSAQGTADRVFGNGLYYRLARVPCCVGFLVAEPHVGYAKEVVSGLPLDWRNLRPHVTYVDRGLHAPVIRFERYAVSPYDGWVSARDWVWVRSEWAGIPDILAVTEVGGTIGVARDGVLAYVAERPVKICSRANKCRTFVPTTTAHVIRVFQGETIRTKGWCAIGQRAEVARTVTGLHGQASLVYASPGAYGVRLNTANETFVVLRERYDGRWALRGATGEHLRVDGYANGWLIHRPLRDQVGLVFTPQKMFDIARVGSLALYLALALAWLFFQVSRYRSRLTGAIMFLNLRSVAKRDAIQ